MHIHKILQTNSHIVRLGTTHTPRIQPLTILPLPPAQLSEPNIYSRHQKMPIPTWITIAIGVATGIILARVDYNMVFMKFFRDLSRSKARKRLHGNKFALVPMMLGIEKPIKIQDDIDAENQMTITREQLEEMDGFDGAPLYLSIKGRVYDVTAGSRFYGEGKEYHDWVGKDASRSFGMGCRGGVDRTGQECLSASLEGLEDKVSRNLVDMIIICVAHHVSERE